MSLRPYDIRALWGHGDLMNASKHWPNMTSKCRRAWRRLGAKSRRAKEKQKLIKEIKNG